MEDDFHIARERVFKKPAPILKLSELPPQVHGLNGSFHLAPNIDWLLSPGALSWAQSVCEEVKNEG